MKWLPGVALLCAALLWRYCEAENVNVFEIEENHRDNSFFAANARDGMIEKAFDQAEAELLTQPFFYPLRDTGQQGPVVLQVDDGARPTNDVKEASILAAYPHIVFVGFCNKIEMIQDETATAYNMDSIHHILQNEPKARHPVSMIILNVKNGLTVRNSKFIKIKSPNKRPVLILNNKESENSRELITTLVSSGFDVFWYIPLARIEADNIDLEWNSTELLNHIPIRLIAVPIEVTESISGMLARYDGVIPVQFGKYFLNEYHVIIELIRVENMYEFKLGYGSEATEMKHPHRFLTQDNVLHNTSSSLNQTIDTLNKSVYDINISLEAMLDESREQGIEAFKNVKIRYPFFYSIEAEKLYNDTGDDHRMLLFPRDLISEFQLRFLEYYCNQIVTAFSNLGYDQPYMHNTCAIYLSHLLKEAIDEKPSSVYKPCNSQNCFNGWRDRKRESPGISLHVNATNHCVEPVFCNRGHVIQQKIYDWQHPPVVSNNSSSRSCENAKFLVYQASFRWASIGSFLHQTTWLLQYAMCNNRILLMPSKRMLNKLHRHYMSKGITEGDYSYHLRWFHEFCPPDKSLIDCYFQDLSSCRIDEEQYFDSMLTYAGTEPELAQVLVSNKKYVVLSFLPFSGKCSIGANSWDGSFDFFGDLDLGLARFMPHAKLHEWGAIHELLSPEPSLYGPFAEGDSLPMKAQLMRYIVRPRRWFSDALSVAIRSRLSNGAMLPRPFANLHVRYGEKILEMKLVPLHRYMKVLKGKAPHIKDVFVTTETEEVFANLSRDYPDYTFYYTRFERNTHLHTNLKKGHIIDYQMDFFMSISNLFVSTEADFFVGTLLSGWCQLINLLQRTRGDGGREYNSLDGA